jgi:hypothetical protein
LEGRRRGVISAGLKTSNWTKWNKNKCSDTAECTHHKNNSWKGREELIFYANSLSRLRPRFLAGTWLI